MTRNPATERWPKFDLIGLVFNHWRVTALSHRDDNNVVNGIWFWDVECTNCGYKTKRSTNYLKKSKGCICCGLKPKGEAGLNKVYSCYKDSASSRSLLFDLSKDDVKALTSADCFYCGRKPDTLKKRKYKHDRSEWGNYYYNGIDRVDNNLGYIMSNCVTCCEICNRAKGALDYASWIHYLTRFAHNAKFEKLPFLNQVKSQQSTTAP